MTGRIDLGLSLQKLRPVAPERAGGAARPRIMGILNLTPDSFSDGGSNLDPARAVAAAQQMLNDGADLLDLGAESTRPGAQRVSATDQLARLLPVLRKLEGFPLPLTVDTTLAEVAAAALDLGVAGINDISAATEDPQMLGLVARTGAAIFLMHMQGTPETMQIAPTYQNVTAEVGDYLAARLDAARSAGISEHLLVADPGIGFGKTQAHNLQLLRDLPALQARLNVPLLVGTSRKGFLGALTGRKDPADRIFATAGSVAWAAANGAGVLRVHDVAAMRDVVRIVYAIANADRT